VPVELRHQDDHQRAMTLDEILATHEASEPPVDKAWRDLCGAAVGLGAALARFQGALDAYGAAKRAEP
jgi:hypothetical protein